MPDQPQSAQANDTASELSAVQSIIEERRDALGIVPGPEPQTLKLPFDKLLRPLSDEQARKSAERRRDFDELVARQRDAERRRNLEAAVGRDFLSKGFKEFIAAKPAQKAALEACMGYWNEWKENLQGGMNVVLFGPVGTGKDHLAWSIADLVSKEGYPVGWINGQDWFGAIRDAMDKHDEEDRMIRRLVHPDLLVISDPTPPDGPTVALSPFQKSMLYRVVNARSIENKPIIVTANVIDDKEADARIGAATWDRLCYKSIKIKCAWATARRPLKTVNC